MTDAALFLVGVGTTLAASFAILTFLRGSLKRLLLDICGTEHRAAFWTEFSMVVVMLLPLIFAMHFHPQRGLGETAVFAVSRQIEWGLIGLAGAVLSMGVVISLFIPAATGRAGQGA